MRLLLPVFLIFTFVSCQKADRDLDNSTNAAEDYILAQTVYSDVYKQMREVALNSQGLSNTTENITSLYGCDVVEVDTTTYPMTAIIDFAFIGCGPTVERNGRLVGKFYGKFGEPNSTLDIEFVNYYMADFEVGGVLRIIFDEPNSKGNDVHSFFLQGGWIDDGDVKMLWTTSQKWEVKEETDQTVFYVYGTSNGVNRKGNVFYSEMKKINVTTDQCFYMISGTADLEVTNLSHRFLDYGAGSCDKAAEVTINGAIYPVGVKF